MFGAFKLTTGNRCFLSDILAMKLYPGYCGSLPYSINDKASAFPYVDNPPPIDGVGFLVFPVCNIISQLHNDPYISEDLGFFSISSKLVYEAFVTTIS